MRQFLHTPTPRMAGEMRSPSQQEPELHGAWEKGQGLQPRVAGAPTRNTELPTEWPATPCSGPSKPEHQDQQHAYEKQSSRGTEGLPPSLPAWKPAFWFPAQPASKHQAPQACFQSREEQETALLRPDTDEPSSDSHSIPEPTAHSRLCCSPLQCLPSHQARPETLQSQFRR